MGSKQKRNLNLGRIKVFHGAQAFQASYLSVVNSNHDEESCILPIDQLKILIFNERTLEETQLDIKVWLTEISLTNTRNSSAMFESLLAHP